MYTYVYVCMCVCVCAYGLCCVGGCVVYIYMCIKFFLLCVNKYGGGGVKKD